MFTKLLVGVDGSPAAGVALAQALRIGSRFQSTILVLHVTRLELLGDRLYQTLGAPWTERPSDPGASGARDIDLAARHVLEEAAGAVRKAGLEVETIHRRGSLVQEFWAAAEKADAVVVGRIGLRAGGDPLGPDTRALIMKSPVPVLVCGSSPSPIDRCAIVFDGETDSTQALAFAARYAAIAEAHLDVIHVATAAAAGREILARAAVALSQWPLRFETHLVHGEADEAAARTVQRLGCNALFTGAHRAEGRWLVPSHTEAILRATDIPVLVHSQPQDSSVRVSAAYRRPSSG